MNIFILDQNPILAAQYHCDKHVVKMVLEHAQMISTVLQLLSVNVNFDLYKSTHVNHPCVKWIQSSSQNFTWFVNHAMALSDEYTFRYKKQHKSSVITKNVFAALQNISSNFPTGPMSSFALALPDYLKFNDPVLSYRLYYATKKAKFAKWDKNRCEPYWWFNLLQKVKKANLC